MKLLLVHSTKIQKEMKVGVGRYFGADFSADKKNISVGRGTKVPRFL